MSDSRERVDYAGLARFKEDLLDVVYAHIDNNNNNNNNNDSPTISKEEIIDDVYPVGSIYMSINSTSPATLFGGTWEQIKDTFLLAAGDTYESGETGGEAVHTLSVSEMPSHSHTMDSHTHSIPSLSGTAASAGSHTHSISGHTHSIPSLSGTAAAAGNHRHTLAYNLYSVYNEGDGSFPIVQSNGIYSAGAPVSWSDSHTHTVTTASSTTGSTSLTTGSASSHTHSVTTEGSTSGSTVATMSDTGSSDPHNNMPPYLTVYMWQRIA